MSLPSTNQLKKNKQANKGNSGYCHEVYLNARQRLNNVYKNKILRGIIACDEMKLRSGICWSTSNHKMLGFVDDELCFRDLVNAFMIGTESDNSTIQENKIASYVNQWMWRHDMSAEKISCEYFFSHEPISGRELRNQYMHVVFSLESVGLLVDAICIDAGGGNSKLFQLLRIAPSDIKKPNLAWLPDEFVVSIHPCDSSRKMFLFPCGVHGKNKL